MSFFGRAGNLLKGFLRKPVEALEERLENRQKGVPEELSDSELGALERAREAVAETESRAKPLEKPTAKPAEEKKPGRRTMGPDE